MPNTDIKITHDIHQLREELLKMELNGRFIHVEKLAISLRHLYQHFTDEEIYYVLGFRKEDEAALREIENEKWSFTYLITSMRAKCFVGFARIIMVHESQRIVAIHGGCINSRFYDKICLIEAWILGINYCIKELNCVEIRTTCDKRNQRAHKLNLRAGYIVVDEDEYLFHYKLDYKLFNRLSSRITKNYFSKHLNQIHQHKF